MDTSRLAKLPSGIVVARKVHGETPTRYAFAASEGSRTVAVIEELHGESRTREIGRMLSGQKLTDEALRNAEQLIRSSV